MGADICQETLSEAIRDRLTDVEVDVRAMIDFVAIHSDKADVYIQEEYFPEWDHSEFVATCYDRRTKFVFEIAEVDFESTIRKVKKYLKEYV